MSRSSTPPPCASSSSTPTASPSGSADQAAGAPAEPACEDTIDDTIEDTPDDTIDLRGEVCPYTFVRMRLRLEDMPLGARLAVLVDHEPAVRNIPRSAREWGQEIESVGPATPAAPTAPATWQIIVRKRVP